MTPAERLKQIEEDATTVHLAIGGDDSLAVIDRATDALARLVAWAKKGAEHEARVEKR